MFDERYSFLNLGEADSALVFGYLSDGMAEFLASTLSRVVYYPLDDKPFRYLATKFRDKITILPLEKGTFPTTKKKVDVVIALWTLAQMGEIAGFLQSAHDALKPKGSLIIVDEADRLTNEQQANTRTLLDCSRKAMAYMGASVQPYIMPERLQEKLSESGFSSARVRYFTEPDLLADGDDWAACAKHLSQKVEKDKAGVSNIPDEISEQVKRLKKQHKDDFSTPPFYLISSIKSTRRATKPPSQTEAKIYQPPKAVEPEKTDPIVLPPSEPSPKVETPSPKAVETELMKALLIDGAEKLREYELLAVALSGRGYNFSLKTARMLFDSYGANIVSAESNPGRLAEDLGVTIEDAIRIVAVFALARRCFPANGGAENRIRNAEDAYGLLLEMGSLKKEHLKGLYLNIQNKVVHQEIISIGTLSSANVKPRDIFTPALEYAASSIIVAHNHPSGDPSPSPSDIAFTEQIAHAGALLGVELLDHLIIGGETFFSMKKAGLY